MFRVLAFACSALALTDNVGLQPFTTPSGWMGSMGPAPVQAYTQEELADLIEKVKHDPNDYFDQDDRKLLLQARWGQGQGG